MEVFFGILITEQLDPALERMQKMTERNKRSLPKPLSLYWPLLIQFSHNFTWQHFTITLTLMIASLHWNWHYVA